MPFVGVSGLAILFMLAPVWAQGDESASGPSAPPVPAWTVCKAEGTAVRTNRGFRKTFYLSGAVPSPDDRGFGEAFARFIEEKYSGKRDVPKCWSAGSQAEAQDSIEKKVGDSRWNITYVATSWTNTPASPSTDVMSQGQDAETP
jgi:hypothetical protein